MKLSFLIILSAFLAAVVAVPVQVGTASGVGLTKVHRVVTA